jgi:hypothetical protein
MTRLQELDDILDDLDALDVAITIGNFNRLRKKQARTKWVDDESSSFDRWVESRKGGAGRRKSQSYPE